MKPRKMPDKARKWQKNLKNPCLPFFLFLTQQKYKVYFLLISLISSLTINLSYPLLLFSLNVSRMLCSTQQPHLTLLLSINCQPLPPPPSHSTHARCAHHLESPIHTPRTHHSLVLPRKSSGIGVLYPAAGFHSVPAHFRPVVRRLADWPRDCAGL